MERAASDSITRAVKRADIADNSDAQWLALLDERMEERLERLRDLELSDALARHGLE